MRGRRRRKVTSYDHSVTVGSWRDGWYQNAHNGERRDHTGAWLRMDPSADRKRRRTAMTTLKRPASLLLVSACALAIPAFAPAADSARANGPVVYDVASPQGEPSITVTARRGDDQRINDDVMAAIRGDARISGRIGV